MTKQQAKQWVKTNIEDKAGDATLPGTFPEEVIKEVYSALYGEEATGEVGIEHIIFWEDADEEEQFGGQS